MPAPHQGGLLLPMSPPFESAPPTHTVQGLSRVTTHGAQRLRSRKN